MSQKKMNWAKKYMKLGKEIYEIGQGSIYY